MQVEGIQNTKVVVDVNPNKVVNNLYIHFMSSVPGEYINSEGYWESWDDCRGQGSGLYDRYRKATDEEVEIYKAFKVIINFTSDKF